MDENESEDITFLEDEDVTKMERETLRNGVDTVKDDVTFCDLKERRHKMKGVTMVRDKKSEAVSMNDPDVTKLSEMELLKELLKIMSDLREAKVLMYGVDMRLTSEDFADTTDDIVDVNLTEDVGLLVENVEREERCKITLVETWLNLEEGTLVIRLVLYKAVEALELLNLLAKIVKLELSNDKAVREDIDSAAKETLNKRDVVTLALRLKVELLTTDDAPGVNKNVTVFGNLDVTLRYGVCNSGLEVNATKVTEDFLESRVVTMVWSVMLLIGLDITFDSSLLDVALKDDACGLELARVNGIRLAEETFVRTVEKLACIVEVTILKAPDVTLWVTEGVTLGETLMNTTLDFLLDVVMAEV